MEKQYGIISIGKDSRIKVVYESENGKITRTYAYDESNKNEFHSHIHNEGIDPANLQNVLDLAETQSDAKSSLEIVLNKLGI